MDMSDLSLWTRLSLRWGVRQYGARLFHSPTVPPGLAVLYDPEKQEDQLRVALTDYRLEWRGK